jgi:hypothetical protein
LLEASVNLRTASIRVAALVVAVAAGSRALASANVLLNSTFDSNVNGWFPFDGGAVVAYTTTNADGAHPAGSALVSKIGGASDYGFQCVSVTAGTSYVFSGDVFLRAGSNTDERALLGVQFYSGASCTLPLAGYTSDAVTVHVTWSRRSNVVTAPAGATTAAFQLIVSATTIQEAQFDNVNFAPLMRGDANGDGTEDVADVFYMINYLFASGPPPLFP